MRTDKGRGILPAERPRPASVFGVFRDVSDSCLQTRRPAALVDARIVRRHTVRPPVGSVTGVAASTLLATRQTRASTPAYRHALLARRLEVAGDSLRTYPHHPAGRSRWADRIGYASGDGAALRLADHWPRGGPAWLRLTAGLIALLTHATLLPAWPLACCTAREINAWEPRHEWRSSPTRSTK